MIYIVIIRHIICCIVTVTRRETSTPGGTRGATWCKAKLPITMSTSGSSTRVSIPGVVAYLHLASLRDSKPEGPDVIPQIELRYAGRG